ncbi:MAG: putative 2OG-Fe(II) oxygenase [Pseudohongiellaceae bacterium]
MNLFAVPIYKAPMGRQYTVEENNFFRAEMSEPVFAISNYASRNKNVLGSPVLQNLRSEIQTHLNNYFQLVYNTANEVNLAITQSWLARTRQGESHHAHSHPNSVVSGVLYINLDKDDGINFYRNDEQNWYELMPRENNYYNAHSIFVQTEVGSLVLFPSHIKHGVREVTAGIERLSLAFNTFFSGQMGRDDYSNSLSITVK